MIKIYLSRVMKTIMCLMLTGFMSVSAASYSQQITLKGRNIPFETVIDAIRKQSGYTVFGTKKLIESAKPVSIDVKNMPLQQFLNRVTEGQPLVYVIEDKTISLSSPPTSKTTGTAVPQVGACRDQGAERSRTIPKPVRIASCLESRRHQRLRRLSRR